MSPVDSSRIWGSAHGRFHLQTRHVGCRPCVHLWLALANHVTCRLCVHPWLAPMDHVPPAACTCRPLSVICFFYYLYITPLHLLFIIIVPIYYSISGISVLPLITPTLAMILHSFLLGSPGSLIRSASSCPDTVSSMVHRKQCSI